MSQTIEFDINVFAPYLPDAVKQLVLLLGEADTLEIKRRIDYTLNAVIEQSGERVILSFFLEDTRTNCYRSQISSVSSLGPFPACVRRS